jgi:hypothetical protein
MTSDRLRAGQKPDPASCLLSAMIRAGHVSDSHQSVYNAEYAEYDHIWCLFRLTRQEGICPVGVDLIS